MVKDLMTKNMYTPLKDQQKIDFKFKKKGFKKLLIFDLDETLIHVKRDNEEEDSEC